MVGTRSLLSGVRSRDPLALRSYRNVAIVYFLIFGISLRDLGEVMNAYYRASKFSSALVLYFLCLSAVVYRLLRSVTDYAYSLEPQYREKILISCSVWIFLATTAGVRCHEGFPSRRAPRASLTISSRMPSPASPRSSSLIPALLPVLRVA